MSLLLKSLPPEFVKDYVLNQLTWEALQKKYSTSTDEIAKIRIVLSSLGILSSEGILPAPDGFNVLKRSPEESLDHKIEHDSNGTTWTLVGKTRVKTLNELIEVAQVNLAEWEVKSFECRKWDGYSKNRNTESLAGIELWYIKAQFVRKDKYLAYKQEIDAVIEEMKKFSPNVPRIIRKKALTGSKKLLVISIADLHLGKLAWKEESGEDYDAKIAQSIFQNALLEIIADFEHIQIDRILFVIGNDLLNSDNLIDTTTAGTPQTNDSRYHKLFRLAWKLMVQAVQQLLKIADVDIMIIPGNHDEQSAFTIGEVLTAFFRECPNVRIDNRTQLRKAYEWGKTMLMLTHGKEEKFKNLANIAAEEFTELWGRTDCHEGLVGHYHRRAGLTPKEDEEVGFMVRILPSLSGSDDWHYRKGFIGNVRCALGILYDSEIGFKGLMQYTHKKPQIYGEESPLTNFDLNSETPREDHLLQQHKTDLPAFS